MSEVPNLSAFGIRSFNKPEFLKDRGSAPTLPYGVGNYKLHVTDVSALIGGFNGDFIWVSVTVVESDRQDVKVGETYKVCFPNNDPAAEKNEQKRAGLAIQKQKFVAFVCAAEGVQKPENLTSDIDECIAGLLYHSKAETLAAMNIVVSCQAYTAQNKKDPSKVYTNLRWSPG